MIYTDKRVFIDTNILVYANDSSDRVKCDIAKQIILNGITEENAVVSTQVLSEFYVTVTRKISACLPIEQARRQIEIFRSLEVVEISFELILKAIDISQKFDISYWDSQIIASAIHANCKFLLTEDLKHSPKIGNMTIMNPFIDHESKMT